MRSPIARAAYSLSSWQIQRLKASLLRRLAGEATATGWASVDVDFFGVLTLADVAQRIERAYGEQLHGDLASWFVAILFSRGGSGRIVRAAELA